MLIPKVPTEIANNVAYLTLSNLSFKFSKKSGAYAKSLAIEKRWDYFLKTITGIEIFSTLPPLFNIFVPTLVMKSLNNLFWLFTIY